MSEGLDPTGGEQPSNPAAPRAGVRRRKRSGRVKRAWRSSRRPLLWCGLGAGILLVIAAVDVAVRYLPAARALSHGRDLSLQAEALLSGDLAHLDQARLRDAAGLLAEARQDFGERSTIVQDGWIGSLFGHLPASGPEVRALRALRDAGQAGAGLGGDLMPLLQQVLPDPTRPPSSALVRITTGAAANGAGLAAASEHLRALRAAVDAIPGEALLGPLDHARATARRDAPRIESAVAPAIGLLEAVPHVVGAGTHTYLLLLENPSEERPAGGFIGAIGEIVFTDGALTGSTFEDPVILNSRVPPRPAPAPLDAHLFRGHPLELADANWAADFPTAAADVAGYYTAATGHHIDGVISVDPIALGYVLGVTGLVKVPPYPQVITPANALLELDYIANSIRPGDPGKAYLPPFGHNLLEAAIQAPLTKLPALAEALRRGATEKHIALSFHDPVVQKLVSDAGFDGRVSAPLSDALLVDDANLSGSKADLFVGRDYALSAKVDGDGQTHDHLVLTYRNPVQTDPYKARLVTGSGGEYRDYVRVYVPETAQLDRMTLTVNGRSSQVTPETVTWEYQREAIAYWLVVPRGGTSVLTLDYSGPFADAARSPETYALLWEKQVNALSRPAEVTVELPGGRRTHWAAPLDRDGHVSAVAQ